VADSRSGVQFVLTVGGGDGVGEGVGVGEGGGDGTIGGVEGDGSKSY
jgi:hypothetical protein